MEEIKRTWSFSSIQYLKRSLKLSHSKIFENFKKYKREDEAFSSIYKLQSLTLAKIWDLKLCWFVFSPPGALLKLNTLASPTKNKNKIKQIRLSQIMLPLVQIYTVM